MKKIVIAIVLCLYTLSPLTAQAVTSKKHKKIKHHTVAKPQNLPPPPAAKEETKQPENEEAPQHLTGTFDMTTNYVFRGISQTQNLPAVQGGWTYQFDSGIYFNLWGSNVKFVESHADLEIDTIVGWRGDLFNKELGLDINVDRYNYPGASTLNYNELLALATYKFLQAQIGYSANVYNTHKTGIYYNGGINVDLPPRLVYFEDVSFQAAMGHYSLPRAAGNSYNDYSATLSKTIKAYVIALQWTNTNGRVHLPPEDGNHFFVTLTTNF